MYVTLPTEQSVRTCLQTELAICILEQALYPIKHITWCVYALFIDDEERIKRDCKYTVTKVSGNRAISLGGYLWAVSSIKQEQLQVRCLEETHVIEIEPPLQIVYLGNGCEGYSPSMFLPAKNEMTTHAQIESRKEYFLQFNYVYTPDRYIGLWWQFRTRLMSDKDARAFITQVAPLGTMDYSLLQKRPPMIDTKYGFSLPVPPTTLVIGIVVIILLVAGVALGCYVYRMGKTLSLATGTIKKVTEKPLSRLSPPVFQDAQVHLTRYVSTYYTTTKDYRGYARGPCSGNPPSADDENPEGHLPGPSTGPQICQTPGQEGTGRLFCITGARDCTQSRKLHRHSVLETYFQRLSEKAISPHRATPGSVGTICLPLLTFRYNQRNRKLFSLTSPLCHLKGITPS